MKVKVGIVKTEREGKKYLSVYFRIGLFSTALVFHNPFTVPDGVRQDVVARIYG